MRKSSGGSAEPPQPGVPPAGGFCVFAFADGHPGVTWDVLDHERWHKAGYQALKDACQPVIVVAERLPATVAPGDALALDLKSHLQSYYPSPEDRLLPEADRRGADCPPRFSERFFVLAGFGDGPAKSIFVWSDP